MFSELGPGGICLVKGSLPLACGQLARGNRLGGRFGPQDTGHNVAAKVLQRREILLERLQ